MLCLESVVHGHHIHKRICTPMVRDKMLVDVEEDNANKPQAVVVCKCGVVVAHSPWERAKTIRYFLKQGGSGRCEITGMRRKGKELEIPCIYMYV